MVDARTVGKPDYAQALRQLPSDRPLVLLKAGSTQVICSITQAQAGALAARWKTGSTTLSVGGRSVPALWVDAPNENVLRNFLGGSAANCRLVRQKSIFYLPFNLEPGE